MPNVLYIIRGLPGSGKSTIARNMISTAAQHEDIAMFEADMYFEDEDGNYKFEPSKIKDAHEWCQRKVREYLEYNFNVIVSNTFTQVWEFQPYLDMAKEMGVEVRVITATGDYPNVHNVPHESILRMKDRWEKWE